MSPPTIIILAALAMANTVAVVIIILAALALLGWSGVHQQERRRSAPAGAVKVETDVRTSNVTARVKKYRQDGWSLVDQSSAKSFGRSAKVTLTFRKD